MGGYVDDSREEAAEKRDDKLETGRKEQEGALAGRAPRTQLGCESPRPAFQLTTSQMRTFDLTFGEEGVNAGLRRMESPRSQDIGERIHLP
jgi:hypothetical protein